MLWLEIMNCLSFLIQVKEMHTYSCESECMNMMFHTFIIFIVFVVLPCSIKGNDLIDPEMKTMTARNAIDLHIED